MSVAFLFEALSAVLNAKVEGTSSSSRFEVLKERCRRNPKSFAQLLDVGFVEFTFLMQDFGYDAFRTENWDQILLAEAVGVHQRAQDFY